MIQSAWEPSAPRALTLLRTATWADLGAAQSGGIWPASREALLAAELGKAPAFSTDSVRLTLVTAQYFPTSAVVLDAIRHSSGGQNDSTAEEFDDDT